MKTYPSYKPSDFDWIGELPNHWDFIKIKYSLSSLESGSRETGGGNLLDGVFSLGGEHIGWFGELLLNNPKYIPEEYFTNLKNGKIKSGDVLLVKDGATIGKCAVVKKMPFEKCAVNEHVFILRANEKFVPEFIFYFIWCYIGREQILLNIRGSAQPGLNSNFINEVVITEPPFEEQTAIANFLDEKTILMDKLISNKQKLIELLREERAAIIDESVTKGVNQNAKLKASGYDWLGTIPEQWDIKKLRFIGKCQNGISKDREYFGSGFPFVTYGDVYNNETLPMNLSGLAQSSDEDRTHYSVLEGDVFFTRTSETVEEIGLTSTCMENISNATFSGFLIRFRPHKDILFTGFSKFYFRSQIHRKYFVKEMNLVTRASLSQDLLKNFPVLIPPKREQMQIAEYLKTETQRIDNTISTIEKEIDLIQEYRRALISEVVTGKIKVV